jgi:hypothetical protein
MNNFYISLEQVKSALQTASNKNEYLGKFAAFTNGNNGMLYWY